MKITKEILKTICHRGEDLEKSTKMDTILVGCLRSAINGFDFTSCRYNENNQKEVEEMNLIAEKLRQDYGLGVHFDGDEGNMHMFVSWD